jgi:Spy/CpxP family protein refolding chaperone
MAKQSRILIPIATNLFSIVLLFSTALLTCDSAASRDTPNITQSTHVSMITNDIPTSGSARGVDQVMSPGQQEWLFALMQKQATDRHAIKLTAGMALASLQQLAMTDDYDRLQVEKIAQTFGTAMAQLSLLNFQLTSQLRLVLTPDQLKALQENLDKNQQIPGVKM